MTHIERSEAHLASLRPAAQAVARPWFRICRDVLGHDVRVLDGLRSRETQEMLAERGASRVRLGWHNVGLAWDFGIFLDGRYERDDQSGLYGLCGTIGEVLGCVWGGRWDIRPDLPGQQADSGHIEWHPGFTLQQFFAGQTGGLVRA